MDLSDIEILVTETLSYLNRLPQNAADMIAMAQERGVQLLLPVDVRVSKSLDAALGMTVTDLTMTCCSRERPCLPPGWQRTLLFLLAVEGGPGPLLNPLRN